MINKKFINDKLEYIKKYYREFEEGLLKFPVKNVNKDMFYLRAYERIFQLIVDEMLDINTHIISKMDLDKARDYQGTFIVLGEAEILPFDFSRKIAPVVGLRNILVHRYEKIDPELFLKHLKKDREDFAKYVKIIKDYIEKKA